VRGTLKIADAVGYRREERKKKFDLSGRGKMWGKVTDWLEGGLR